MVSLPLTPPSPPVFRITPEWVSRQIARRPPAPETGDRHLVSLNEHAKIVDAAVLVPLIGRSDGVRVLLTQRTPHLFDHGSQVSFPGGRVEAADASREATALREAHEEIGLEPVRVVLLGRLPSYEIPSGFRITPVVGWIDPPVALTPEPFEVAEIFEAPLSHFLDPANYQRREYRFRGRHRHYLAIPFEGRYIWGATAGMLYSLCRALRE